MKDNPLWAWINERHAIYIRKALREGVEPENVFAPDGCDLEESDPYHLALSEEGCPFTHDEVMNKFRFCNVFRELDRVTVWVRENIREPYAEHPDLWIMLAIARYINWPPTLAALIADNPDDWWHPTVLTEGLERRAALGHKVYTGAYMIRAENDKRREWYSWTKHRYIAEVVIGRLWDDRADWQAYLTTDDPDNQMLTLQDTHELFLEQRYIGWGHFMAYEVVTDMRHTRYLERAPDIHTWANAGPGARRGLNRIHGRPLNKTISQDQACDEMQALLSESRQDGVLAPWVPALEMRDVEHSLCETDKWLRAANGEGRPRALFVQGRGS